MRIRGITAGVLLGAMAGLAGCGEGQDDRPFVERVGLTSVNAPDEFAVLPQKPLERPEDVSVLPVPTPGAVNRTDLTPQTDALMALSGRPGRAAPVASDGALVATAAARGADPEIRARLRAEDVLYRQNNRGRLLERLFAKANDVQIYDDMMLSAEAELLRLRALGIRVPALPPAR